MPPPSENTKANWQITDSQLFHYLGHPIRLNIIKALVNGEKTVTEIQSILGDVKQANLSAHLT